MGGRQTHDVQVRMRYTAEGLRVMTTSVPNILIS